MCLLSRGRLILLGCLLLVMSMQVIAAGRSIALLDRSPPGLSLSAELQAVLSLIWAAGAGFGIIALLRQGGRAALYAQAVLASFVLYTGLRVYIFARADYDRQRLPFLIVVGLCGLLGMFVVLMGDRHRREKNMERSNDR